MIDWSLFLTVIGMVFTILTTVIATTWSVHSMMNKRDAVLVRMITDHENADSVRFGAINTQLEKLGGTFTNYLGETGRALREHMHKIELSVAHSRTENLETFVRRDSYLHIMKGLDVRFDKLEAKIDQRHPVAEESVSS